MSDHVIYVSKLEFSYEWYDPPVLRVPEVTIAPGKRFFVQGASGSGKSTFLSLLAGVLEPTEGSVSMLNTSLSSLSPSQRDQFRADHIGYIFQQFNLVPYLNMIENVTLPCRFSDVRNKKAGDCEQQARHLLAELGLTDDAMLKRPVSTLSVGQQQRVAAARALIGAPEILIADEPTSALDHDQRAAFISLLFKLSSERNMTVVFVSHDSTLAGMFDEVYELPPAEQVMGGSHVS